MPARQRQEPGDLGITLSLRYHNGIKIGRHDDNAHVEEDYLAMTLPCIGSSELVGLFCTQLTEVWHVWPGSNDFMVQCHQSSGMRHIVPLAVPSRQVIVNPVRSLDVPDHVIVPSRFCLPEKWSY